MNPDNKNMDIEFDMRTPVPLGKMKQEFQWQ